MRKPVPSCAALVAFMACLAWASNEPWKTKPYLDWSQKDVLQILRDSPWVKKQTVDANWSKSSAPQITFGSVIIAGDEPPVGAASMPTRQDTAEAEFLLRWNSSRTIRKALGRDAILNNKISAAEAEKYVQQAPPDFQIAVLGEDMTPFEKADDADLRQVTTIEAKPSKHSIRPSGVHVIRTADGKRVIAVLFNFPRQIQSGQPLIAQKDASIEFACKLKGLTLHADFELRKMVGDKGPDL